jgi:hypothetical protein
LVEHATENRSVASSILALGTIFILYHFQTLFISNLSFLYRPGASNYSTAL